MRKISKKIREELYKTVSEKARLAGYGNTNRAISNTFIDDLTSDPSVGGKLKEFLKRDKIRTYIKDTLLNKYMKVINVMPRDVDKLIIKQFKRNTVEVNYKANDRSSLHRFTSKDEINEENGNKYLVVSRGTYVKWETALRKALKFISSNEFLKEETDVLIMIAVKTNSTTVTEVDKKVLSKSLELLGVSVAFFE